MIIMDDVMNTKVVTKRYKGPDKILGRIDHDEYESNEKVLEIVK
jgi:hypothetical protein